MVKKGPRECEAGVMGGGVEEGLAWKVHQKRRMNEEL